MCVHHFEMNILGCNHGKVDQNRVLVYLFLGGGFKGLKVVAKCCLNWIYLCDDFNCFVKYSIVEYQVQSFKVIIKSDAEKLMFECGFERKFHDLR